MRFGTKPQPQTISVHVELTEMLFVALEQAQTAVKLSTKLNKTSYFAGSSFSVMGADRPR